MNDTSEDQEDLVYEFVAAGENTCERCAALGDSQWREPPNPPHAHCACEVQVRPSGLHRPRECGDTQWSVAHLPRGTVRYGPRLLDGFEWGFLVTIDCWDGLVHEFEIWVDMGNQADYPTDDTEIEVMEAYAWSEIHDEAEAIAVRVCRPCQPALLS